MYGAPTPAATPSLQDPLEGGRPPVRHYAGLGGVIKPAIACPSANECRFLVIVLLGLVGGVEGYDLALALIRPEA